ncbi:MAG: hypothetical protein KGR16_06485 [Verrucomicrobia bacterium]|nr:hypothetical protein [Verrucomicrobiota bacterium]MDE3047059.1 hypothetical protein [Verrucomicrobiota bacterium]
MDLAQAQNWFINLSERKKQIAVSIASVIAGVVILIAYFQAGPNALKYAEAEDTFSKWIVAPPDEALYQNMLDAMRHVPALHKKYESAIAQKLINTDKLDEAIVMANRSLVRVKEEVPFHATYAMTSLLIEQGKYQEALEKAVALKEQMGSAYFTQQKGGALLYVHNLLRIACLQQQLHNRPGEKAAWEELSALLATKSRSVQRLLGNFSDKQINLSQYIAERIKNLS